MLDSLTNSRKRQIRTTSNEGTSSLYETDNPTEHRFPRGLPESNTDGRSAHSMHHPLINGYDAEATAAAAVLPGKNNCDSSAIFRRFAAEHITEEEAS